MPRVIPVGARSDNYMYIIAAGGGKAVAVDPYDVPKIKAAADKEGLSFSAVLTTHHHFDHAGGNKKFLETFLGTPVYGGSKEVEALTNEVKDGSTLSIGDLEIQCLHTPCHTQDSICYFVHDKTNPSEKAVFTGDTLFTGGCGRFFEGTAAEMHAALTKLGGLPDDTLLYNGHEYTAGNLAFGRHVDPQNAGIAKLKALVDKEQVTAGKSTIGDEKEWNVFMRLDSKPVQSATGETDTTKIMNKLRDMKNNFKA
ncbi:hydroxyacylglutathione hydrolase [Exidia glandulosa HHB12029]|uniref:hydroxyacylglutathione hydrolase n=1 Tax=Exidia glandulosa HHB12029 TaxID=1314781 RepID=A0A165ZMH3_EXIGL|nr:hydroxyacylglutathione hydrolase [Exidia glandulosa HHB12029]